MGCHCGSPPEPEPETSRLWPYPAGRAPPSHTGSAGGRWGWSGCSLSTEVITVSDSLYYVDCYSECLCLCFTYLSVLFRNILENSVYLSQRHIDHFQDRNTTRYLEAGKDLVTIVRRKCAFIWMIVTISLMYLTETMWRKAVNSIELMDSNTTNWLITTGKSKSLSFYSFLIF